MVDINIYTVRTVGTYRYINTYISTYRPLEAEVGAYEGQRSRYTKPEREDGNEGAKRNGGTASLSPQHKVQQEEEAKYGAERNGYTRTIDLIQ